MCNAPIHWYGIIDPKNSIDDIAILFHQGITDYIPKKLIKSQIDQDRIKRMVAFRTCSRPHDVTDNRRKLIVKAPVKGWESVEEGREYTFVMLFIRIEKAGQMQNSYGYSFSDKMITSFLEHLKRSLIPHQGKQWLTDSRHTLFLFPYTNNNSGPIQTAFSFMLNSPIISGEYLKSPLLLTSTMILHLGNIRYFKQEKAGTSISPALNFIFHAASSSVSPGRFYVTDMLYSDIPEELNDIFIDAHHFEGHDLKVVKEISFTDKV
jgi:hypothetical protein